MSVNARSVATTFLGDCPFSIGYHRRMDVLGVPGPDFLSFIWMCWIFMPSGIIFCSTLVTTKNQSVHDPSSINIPERHCVRFQTYTQNLTNSRATTKLFQQRKGSQSRQSNQNSAPHSSLLFTQNLTIPGWVRLAGGVGFEPTITDLGGRCSIRDHCKSTHDHCFSRTVHPC